MKRAPLWADEDSSQHEGHVSFLAATLGMWTTGHHQTFSTPPHLQPTREESDQNEPPHMAADMMKMKLGPT